MRMSLTRALETLMLEGWTGMLDYYLTGKKKKKKKEKKRLHDNEQTTD